jgi:hypothetical protein
VEFGHPDFDDLNQQLGLQSLIHPWGGTWVGMCLSLLANLRVAAQEYLAIPAVEYAYPDPLAGDGPDTAVKKEGDNWYVVIRDAYGDCPAGCIGQTLYFFVVGPTALQQVTYAEALADPIFRPLAETWGPQRLDTPTPTPPTNPVELPNTGGSR